MVQRAYSDERTTEERTQTACSHEFMTNVVCECNGHRAGCAREMSVRSVRKESADNNAERAR